MLKTEPGTAFFWSGCAKVDPSTGKLITSGDEVPATNAKLENICYYEKIAEEYDVVLRFTEKIE